MKAKTKITAIIPFLLLFFNPAFGKDYVIEGIYQGENLFVNNPFTSTGVNFCIYEVLVNDKQMTDGVQSSSFEIDFPSFDIRHGEKVKVILKHREGCSPKILNPCAIKPNSTFVLKTIEIFDDGVLKWTTTQESSELYYYVEQYRWNRWLTVGKIMGKGNYEPNNYKVNVKLHTGKNRFRVKQIDCMGKPRFSREATYRKLQSPITFEQERNAIIFSAPTQYEVYDGYATRILKGYGKEVDISKLKKGDYFLNYDNSMVNFTK